MSTLDQRLDQIILSLKVISQLSVGQYLLFKNNNVAIRKFYHVITPVIRTIANESRNDTTEGLKCLLDNIDGLISDYLKSPELSNSKPSEFDRSYASNVFVSLNRIKLELPNVYNISNKGLNGAKATYQKDPVTRSKIEGIIDRSKFLTRKIHSVLDDLDQKYTITEEKMIHASE